MKIKSRLKKMAEVEYTINFEEMKLETIKAINNMKSKVDSLVVRGILRNFTAWSFYNGIELKSINEVIAEDICDKLLIYVNSIRENNQAALFDIYNEIIQYSK